MQVYQAHAKINLYLRIAGRRPDGYHEIETVFQRLELCDLLRVETIAGGDLALECDEPALAALPREKNLVVRAYDALAKRCPGALSGLRVELSKSIPAGGGLGGGSSDAAATLRAAREAFALEIGDDALREIALSLGADVPFFLGPPCAIGRGIGERLEPLHHAAQCVAVLALPPYGISTSDVYRRYDPERPAEGGDLAALRRALESGDCCAILDAMWNEMEDLAFALRPELGALRRRLEESAERPVRMTGSGSTLLTLAGDLAEGERVAGVWRRHSDVGAIVTPFSHE